MHTDFFSLAAQRTLQSLLTLYHNLNQNCNNYIFFLVLFNFTLSRYRLTPFLACIFRPLFILRAPEHTLNCCYVRYIKNNWMPRRALNSSNLGHKKLQNMLNKPRIYLWKFMCSIRTVWWSRHRQKKNTVNEIKISCERVYASCMCRNNPRHSFATNWRIENWIVYSYFIVHFNYKSIFFFCW